jgi:hypothetical protein
MPATVIAELPRRAPRASCRAGVNAVPQQAQLASPLRPQRRSHTAIVRAEVAGDKLSKDEPYDLLWSPLLYFLRFRRWRRGRQSRLQAFRRPLPSCPSRGLLACSGAPFRCGARCQRMQLAHPAGEPPSGGEIVLPPRAGSNVTSRTMATYIFKQSNA